jgi:hypothetical protein
MTVSRHAAVSIASRGHDGDGDDDGGDLEGWESTREGGKWVCLAARRSPHSVSDVPQGTDALDSCPWLRDRHGDADDSIRLEN